MDDAVNQIRNELLPIADDDALWLAKIADTHSARWQMSRSCPISPVF